MKVVMVHCDDKVVELCDYKGHGTLILQESWSFVMTMVMEKCDERGHGALC